MVDAGPSTATPSYGTIPVVESPEPKPQSRIVVVGLSTVFIMVGALIMLRGSGGIIEEEVEATVDAAFLPVIGQNEPHPEGVRGVDISIGPTTFKFMSIATDMSVSTSKDSCMKIEWNKGDSTSTQTWNDDWLCTSTDLAMAWSSTGPIDGLRCSQVVVAKWGQDYEGWDQHYICLPQASLYDIEYSEEPEEHRNCLDFSEPEDPLFTTGYLCIDWTGAHIFGSQDVDGDVVISEPGHTPFTCNNLCLGLSKCDYWVLGVDPLDPELGLCWAKNGNTRSFHDMHIISAPHVGHMTGVPYRCGDGILNDAAERCDDGNTEDGDGCDAECRPEDGYYCPIQFQHAGICHHIAECTGPFDDACTPSCDTPSWCKDDFAEHLPGGRIGVLHIHDASTCRNCCDLAYSECHSNVVSHKISSCRIEPANKEAHQACVEKCADICEPGCVGDHDSPWWQRLPVAERHVAFSAVVNKVKNPSLVIPLPRLPDGLHH